MSLFQNTSATRKSHPIRLTAARLVLWASRSLVQISLSRCFWTTKPQCFSDLIRIAGLGHGTDVWLGNAQTLIQEGKATISTAICCRDDIMTYLINMGLDKEQSFTIMESVRKGKGLKPEWEEEMTSHGVPDWYIWSCKQIKYMFPKAHAAAYMIATLRLGWYKVHKPVEYYAAYFTVRSENLDGAIAMQGHQAVRDKMNNINKNRVFTKQQPRMKQSSRPCRLSTK